MSIYGLGVEPMHSESEVRVEVWTARATELEASLANWQATACQQGEYPCFPLLAIKMPLQLVGTCTYASIQQDVSFVARRSIFCRQGYKSVHPALPDLFCYTQFS